MLTIRANPRKTNQKLILSRSSSRCVVAVLIFWGLASIMAGAADRNPEANEVRILQIQGSAEIMPSGAKTWVLTQTNQVLHPGDKLRTGDNSRVALRWSDQSVVPFGALTEIEILPPEKSDSLSGLNLV